MINGFDTMKLQLSMWDATEGDVGELAIHFSSPMTYTLSGCAESLTQFNIAPSTNKDKLWTFMIEDYALQINCNGHRVSFISLSSIESPRCTSKNKL